MKTTEEKWHIGAKSDLSHANKDLPVGFSFNTVQAYCTVCSKHYYHVPEDTEQ